MYPKENMRQEFLRTGADYFSLQVCDPLCCPNFWPLQLAILPRLTPLITNLHLSVNSECSAHALAVSLKFKLSCCQPVALVLESRSWVKSVPCSLCVLFLYFPLVLLLGLQTWDFLCLLDCSLLGMKAHRYPPLKPVKEDSSEPGPGETRWRLGWCLCFYCHQAEQR